MSRFPVSVVRGNRQPPAVGGTSIVVIGDTHLGSAQESWSYKALDDLNRMVGRGQVAAWLHAGDQTTTAVASELTSFKAWWAALNRGSAPSAFVPGNHDTLGNQLSGNVDVQTPEQWATGMASLGVTARDYVVDVGANLRIVCLSPTTSAGVGTVAHTYRLTVDAVTLAWADARINETSRRCIVMFHAPLYGTYGVNSSSTAWSSYDLDWCAHSQDAYTIEQMIGSHPNVIAYVSGHTHSAMDQPDLVKRVQIGVATFAAISASSPLVLPTGSVPQIVSALMTVYPDRIEVRYRDHGAGQWLSPVYTVTF